jgi:hypothetical protein
MAILFDHLAFWHWWILAALLSTVEILAPGFFFIWLAGAAVATGLTALVLQALGWEIQILIFAVLAILSLFAWHRLGRRLIRSGPLTTLNRRGDQLVGRTVVLTEAIVNGRGRARVNDSVWRVEGVDLPAGSNVVITGCDGTVLRVEPGKSIGD